MSVGHFLYCLLIQEEPGSCGQNRSWAGSSGLLKESSWEKAGSKPVSSVVPWFPHRPVLPGSCFELLHWLPMVVNYDLEIYTKINLFQLKLLLVREFCHRNLKTNQENYPVSQSLDMFAYRLHKIIIVWHIFKTSICKTKESYQNFSEILSGKIKSLEVKQCFAGVNMVPWSSEIAGWCTIVWSLWNCRLHLSTCCLAVGSPWLWATREAADEGSFPTYLIDISLWPMMLPRDHVDACGPCFLFHGTMKSKMHVTVCSLCYCLMLWWYPWALLPLGAILKWVDRVAIWGHVEIQWPLKLMRVMHGSMVLITVMEQVNVCGQGHHLSTGGCLWSGLLPEDT